MKIKIALVLFLLWTIVSPAIILKMVLENVPSSIIPFLVIVGPILGLVGMGISLVCLWRYYKKKVL